MAEKFRRWSTYNYCDDDPIRMIDPDGMGATDNYKLLKNGDIKLVQKTNDKTDKIYATDSKGGIVKNKALEVSKDFMKSHQTVKNSNGSTGDVYQIRNNKDGGQKAFEFFANNTGVEFSSVRVERDDHTAVTVLQTDHSDNSVSLTGVANILLEGGAKSLQMITAIPRK